MRSGKIRLAGIAALSLLALTQAASAFYSPAMGRFISRDPIGEPGAALVQSAARPATEFMPRDPSDRNGYTGMQNNVISWFDPDGGQATSLPSPPPDATEPVGTDCGVEVNRSPLCFEHLNFQGCNLGHTWIVVVADGKTMDYPPNYIEGDHKCQKNNVEKRWKTKTSSSNKRSCTKILKCLQDKEDEWAATKNFSLFGSTCRDFVSEALSECGLDRSDPPYHHNKDMYKEYCCSPCGRMQTRAKYPHP